MHHHCMRSGLHGLVDDIVDDDIIETPVKLPNTLYFST